MSPDLISSRSQKSRNSLHTSACESEGIEMVAQVYFDGNPHTLLPRSTAYDCGGTAALVWQPF